MAAAMPKPIHMIRPLRNAAGSPPHRQREPRNRVSQSFALGELSAQDRIYAEQQEAERE